MESMPSPMAVYASPMEVGFAGGSIFKKLFAVVPIWDESENAVPTCNKNIKQIKAASFLTDSPFSVL
jgi:hypothetical protein